MSRYLPSPLNETEYSELIQFMVEDKDLLYSFADQRVISMPKPRTKNYEDNIEEVRGKVNHYF